MQSKKLLSLRNKIDHLDKQIVNLLNSRTKLSLEVGRLKKDIGHGIYSPDREQQVLKKASANNKGPLKNDAIESIFREVMSGSLSLNDNFKVAYLGPLATFSHQAALKKFGSQVEYVPCRSIRDVFIDVEKENCNYGVVPIENTIEGAISYTLDLLVDYDLKICAQVILNISHSLLSRCGINSIKKIYSNPQVFPQCRIWLENNLPKVSYCEVASTALAAKIASKEKNSACIASILAAKEYSLKIIASGIEDSPHNITRFLVIGKAQASASGNDKTSIIFSIKDKIGALHDMLVPFKKHNINLTKIESRPSKKKAWDYYFFVDLAGHIHDKKVKAALRELEDKCKFIKVLGSYPAKD